MYATDVLQSVNVTLTEKENPWGGAGGGIPYKTFRVLETHLIGVLQIHFHPNR